MRSELSETSPILWRDFGTSHPQFTPEYAREKGQGVAGAAQHARIDVTGTWREGLPSPDEEQLAAESHVDTEAGAFLDSQSCTTQGQLG